MPLHFEKKIIKKEFKVRDNLWKKWGGVGRGRKKEALESEKIGPSIIFGINFGPIMKKVSPLV